VTHRGFDEQMAVLEALKGCTLDAASIAAVKKALGSRSNFLVAKAARLAEDNQLKDLVPDLLAAFERFFTHPEKSDPQCWAKNAVSRALSRLECRDKEVFLRGLNYHQWEPVWGGKSDTAGALRANCAHALIGCDGLDNRELLILLLDPLTDHDKSVRLEAVRALAQLGDVAVPVLRLRALEPGTEAEEMLGQCFAALAAIEGDAAIPFIARFLRSEDDAAGDAAFALAETHRADALAALRKRIETATDPWFLAVLLSAVALTRLAAGIDYLLGLIESEDRQAEVAIEALARLAPSSELRERIERVVEETGSQRLKKAWVEQAAGSTPRD
jgi:HEAT repeat protein